MNDPWMQLVKSPLYDWTWYRSNPSSKEYQGRAEDGTFGSGTSGGSDSKEQELRDRDAGKQAAPPAPATQKEPPGQAVKKLYDGFQNISFQDIQPQVEEHFGKLSPQDAKQAFKQAFGFDANANSRSGVIKLATRLISERKESFERIQFGQKPIKQSNTQLPDSVKPTIPHKLTGARPEFIGINPASPNKTVVDVYNNSKKETRESINAAFDALQKQNLSSAKLSELARQMDISRKFPSKEALLQAMRATTLERLGAYLRVKV